MTHQRLEIKPTRVRICLKELQEFLGNHARGENTNLIMKSLRALLTLSSIPLHSFRAALVDPDPFSEQTRTSMAADVHSLFLR